MRCGGYIPDSDSLFRQSVYPVSFKGRAFAWDKCLNLSDQNEGSLLASLTWERYVPTEKLIHGYGCRLAFRRNERKLAAAKLKDAEAKLKDKDRQVYCGAYELKGKAIRDLQATEGLDEILSADVVHHVEVEGEIAHADLRIFLKPGSVASVEGTKTAIEDRLWNNCSGPLRHICDCDKDIAEHPSASLATPPAGAYSDTRSYTLRLWCMVRFQICDWLWRNNLWH
jgi:hypothetical protein